MSLNLFAGLGKPKRNKLFDPNQDINQENLPYQDDSWWGKALGRDADERNAQALLATATDTKNFKQQTDSQGREIGSREGIATADRNAARDRLMESFANDEKKMTLADVLARKRDQISHMFDKENFTMKFGHDKDMAGINYDNELGRMGAKHVYDRDLQGDQFDFTAGENKTNRDFQSTLKIAEMIAGQPKEDAQVQYYNTMSRNAGAGADQKNAATQGLNWRNGIMQGMLQGGANPTGQVNQVVGKIQMPGAGNPIVAPPQQAPAGNMISDPQAVNQDYLKALKLLQGWTARGGQ